MGENLVHGNDSKMIVLKNFSYLIVVSIIGFFSY